MLITCVWVCYVDMFTGVAISCRFCCLLFCWLLGLGAVLGLVVAGNSVFL